MLAQSAQKCFRMKTTYTMLSWSACANAAYDNYLGYIGPQPINNFAQENYLQCFLDLCGAILRKEITCAMFGHG